MRYFLSISFALLMILSGMHLSYARHFCGGEVSSSKWSFSAEKATCEMEVDPPACPVHHSITSDCCANQLLTFSIDDNYKTTSVQVKEVTKKLLQVYSVPSKIFIHSFHPVNLTNSGVAPPDIPLASAVSLENICNFRI